MIEFQRPYDLGNSMKYIEDSLAIGQLSGDGKYTKRCSDWIKDKLQVGDVLMTTSCTHSLELACHMLELDPEDEIIMPSFTYPSTANAVMMAGGKVVFSQVRSGDMTLDPDRLEDKINGHTRAIIPVHYGGNVCEMDRIMAIAKKHDLAVIEDCAQAFLSTYKGKRAGSFGDFGCFSFHGTKDLVAGEGGALSINNPIYGEDARVFREKGTNRQAFLQGRVSRYEWVSKGSSYSPSDLLMALLYGQLTLSETVLTQRQALYKGYIDFFRAAQYPQLDGYSKPAEDVTVNGHTYWIRFRNTETADGFRAWMSEKGIDARTHFVPLHKSAKGQALGLDQGTFEVEEEIGKRLVRLPLYPDLGKDDLAYILSAINDYMEGT